MQADYTVILAYAVGIILIFVLGRVFLVPIKMLLKLFYNAILGAIALLIINFVGGLFGFHIAFNLVTAFVAGILGLPGIIFLVILRGIM